VNCPAGPSTPWSTLPRWPVCARRWTARWNTKPPNHMVWMGWGDPKTLSPRLIDSLFTIDGSRYPEISNYRSFDSFLSDMGAPQRLAGRAARTSLSGVRKDGRPSQYGSFSRRTSVQPVLADGFPACRFIDGKAGRTVCPHGLEACSPSKKR
jgi:hypothetical protein